MQWIDGALVVDTTEQFASHRAEEIVLPGLRVLFAAGAPLASDNFVPLLQEAVRIGRDPLRPPHLSFADPRMSRLHAVVQASAEDGRLSVLDLGSTNGTWVNGERVDRCELHPGDTLRTGDTLLLVDELRPAPGGLTPPAEAQTTLVHVSRAMRAVVERTRRAAPTDLAVLVLGESGTGKELVAQELHARSGRRGPFLAVNCGAIAPTLIESELFGHVRGAFTGATSAAEGLFRSADGGTLLLDEIGELPLALQTRLLRVLETGEVRPVGATTTLRVSTRVVAATNIDLDRACAQGTFRGDLFARLDEVRVHLPPLRARRVDILVLAQHFFAKHRGRRPMPTLTADAAEGLLLNKWPYNVRELEKVVRLLLLECPPGAPIGWDHLPAAYQPRRRTTSLAFVQPGPLRDPDGFRAQLGAKPRPDSDDLKALLVHFRGRIVDVAGFLGKDRRQVYRWLKMHAIDADAYRL